VREPGIPQRQQKPGGQRAQQAVNQDQSPHEILYSGWYDCGCWLGKGTNGRFSFFFIQPLVSVSSRPLPLQYDPVSLQIRSSRREDFDTLWQIDQACFPPDQAYSRLELNTYMRRRGAFTLVAESSAASFTTVAGFIVAEANSRGQGHIVTIDVLERARREGIGSTLLGEAETRLREAGCSIIFLETAVDNQPAILFYKRHGYLIEKTIPRYYNGTLDAFLLRKDLLPCTPPR
jgi:[ribosomal protein S18]-alanine N-acetyltransferase